MRLLREKNSLVIKREELRAEIIAMNAAGSFNALVRGYQDLFLRPAQDKLKVKRPLSFDGLKKNFQDFFTGT